MTIANYINDLLYRYDCVIIPNFGGFVTNIVSAKVNHFTHTFYPPTKQISFNSHLQHNDGLLANYIASSENISFEEATLKITETVKEWSVLLTKETVKIKGVGHFSLNEEGKIIFQPKETSNFLTSSFGLSPVHSTAISRFKKEAIPLLVKEEKKKKGIPVFVKYAATAAILLTLGFAGWNGVQQQNQQKIVQNQQKALEQKIQTATFVISNPLPTINLNVSKVAPKKYHIIAGAFQFEENAAKKVKQLKQKGFDAQILGKNKWGLTQVAFASFSDKNKAINTLRHIKKMVSKDAWLFVSK